MSGRTYHNATHLLDPCTEVGDPIRCHPLTSLRFPHVHLLLVSKPGAAPVKVVVASSRVKPMVSDVEDLL